MDEGSAPGGCDTHQTTGNCGCPDWRPHAEMGAYAQKRLLGISRQMASAIRRMGPNASPVAVGYGLAFEREFAAVAESVLGPNTQPSDPPASGLGCGDATAEVGPDSG